MSYTMLLSCAMSGFFLTASACLFAGSKAKMQS